MCFIHACAMSSCLGNFVKKYFGTRQAHDGRAFVYFDIKFIFIEMIVCRPAIESMQPIISNIKCDYVPSQCTYIALWLLLSDHSLLVWSCF
jgi:hypothetical protein